MVRESGRLNILVQILLLADLVLEALVARLQSLRKGVARVYTRFLDVSGSIFSCTEMTRTGANTPVDLAAYNGHIDARRRLGYCRALQILYRILDSRLERVVFLPQTRNLAYERLACRNEARSRVARVLGEPRHWAAARAREWSVRHA